MLWPIKNYLKTYANIIKIATGQGNGTSANINFSKTWFSKMIQLKGYALYEITGPIHKEFSSLPKIIDDKLKNLLKNKGEIYDTIKTVDNSITSIIGIKKVFGTGVTLTDNEIKNIMKVIKSLENIGILLKGTTRKITS